MALTEDWNKILGGDSPRVSHRTTMSINGLVGGVATLFQRGECATISAENLGETFMPERLFVSNRGRGPFEILDVKIDGASIVDRDLLAVNNVTRITSDDLGHELPPEWLYAALCWRPMRRGSKVEISFAYVGDRNEGSEFWGAIHGSIVEQAS